MAGIIILDPNLNWHFLHMEIPIVGTLIIKIKIRTGKDLNLAIFGIPFTIENNYNSRVKATAHLFQTPCGRASTLSATVLIAGLY